MIKNLKIKNYALIDELEIDLFQGLNIITGETGAGKSILLGSLELAMGKRAEINMIKDKSKNCLIELTIDIKDYKLNDFFETNDLTYSEEITLSRTINPNGKSKSYINDEPVNLATLTELSSLLVLIHRQFDNIELNNSDYQLSILDSFAENENLFSDYQHKYKRFKEYQKELTVLEKRFEKSIKDNELFQFQYEELTNADLNKDAFEDVLETYSLLANSENIKKTLYEALNFFSEGDDSLLSRLGKIVRSVNSIDIQSKDFKSSKEELNNVLESIKDISHTFNTLADSIEYDPAKEAECKERIDFVNSLLRKYSAFDLNELLELKRELESKLQSKSNTDDNIAELRSEISRLNSELIAMSIELSTRRKSVINYFVVEIESILKELAMPNARFNIQVESLDELTFSGSDKINFLFSANKGFDFQILKEVASGGELSRLALAIESVIAGKMSLPTLVFDEIEAGISGEVALKMGNILKNISQKHQLINITHSPQIAARADNHYYVFKKDRDDKTITDITLLSKDQRISELAKMLSGDPPTSGAMKNAKELLGFN